jgi:hypothetical protein
MQQHIHIILEHREVVVANSIMSSLIIFTQQTFQHCEFASRAGRGRPLSIDWLVPWLQSNLTQSLETWSE